MSPPRSRSSPWSLQYRDFIFGRDNYLDDKRQKAYRRQKLTRLQSMPRESRWRNHLFSHVLSAAVFEAILFRRKIKKPTAEAALRSRAFSPQRKLLVLLRNNYPGRPHFCITNNHWQDSLLGGSIQASEIWCRTDGKRQLFILQGSPYHHRPSACFRRV